MHPDLDRAAAWTGLLRQLPAEAAQPYSFDEFQRRARQRGRAARRVAGVTALAAALLLALGVAALSMRFGPPPAPPPAAPAGAGRGAPLQPQGGARPDAMEHWLAGLPSEPAVVRPATYAAVLRLEDHLAQVDDILNAARLEPHPPERLLDLQRERTRLVGTLAQVRYAETLADDSL
jgi:hypothetical protein